jgi:hypothetical protein
MQAGDVRSTRGAEVGDLPLHESNGLFAAHLVLPAAPSYSRSLLRQEGLERGGEGPGKGLVPHNNNTHYTNKNNWGAAFVRPIFLSFSHAFFLNSMQRATPEPQ